MKKGYAIVFEEIAEKKNMDEFVEVIRSNYISKQVKSNIYVVSVELTTTSKDVYDMIKSKTSFKPSMLVIKFDHFYGTFINDDALSWLKLQFPSINWLET